jgi:CRP-like cAMP-binding protein
MRIEERLLRRFGRLFRRGSYLFREGDASNEIFYVVSGSVRMIKESGKVDKELKTMGPGEFFGEMAVLINSPRTASALALEDSNVAVVDGETFRNLLRESGEVAVMMLRELALRLRDTTDALEATTRDGLRFQAVLFLAERGSVEPEADVLGELAEALRKSREEVLEILEDPELEGLLTIREGTIVDFRKDRVREWLERE